MSLCLYVCVFNNAHVSVAPDVLANVFDFPRYAGGGVNNFTNRKARERVARKKIGKPAALGTGHFDVILQTRNAARVYVDLSLCDRKKQQL